MPKTWVYILALIIPLVFRVLILNTPMLSWLWYHGYPGLYNALSPLTINKPFLTFIGGWALPIFVVTMIGYWMMETEDEIISSQFLLVPIAYVPFSIVVTMVSTMNVDFHLFYVHPLIIIPIGYVYIMLWVFLIWILEKLGIVS